ncbi:hypothetical protein GCM10009076_00070 [Erythrobacter ramosus]
MTFFRHLFSQHPGQDLSLAKGKAFFMKVLMTGASGQLGGGLLERMPTIPPITPLEDEATTGWPSFAALDCSETRAFLGDGPMDWRANLRLMLNAGKALG